jgi:predicted DCC family thiol-disulfide oxidoreductase YuxK
MQRVILFDGECNFCDASVQFIIKRDPYAHFSFASLQSETGAEFTKQYAIPDDVDSLVLIENNKAYTKSSAALRIAKKLDGLWHLLFLFILVPRQIRDVFYNYFAKNRYKWFGKKELACSLPSPDVRKRFL